MESEAGFTGDEQLARQPQCLCAALCISIMISFERVDDRESALNLQAVLHILGIECLAASV